MELSIRDWMIVIGFLLFVAVVLDGYRRAQRDRRNRVRLSRKAEKARFQRERDEADYPSELPAGGRRPRSSASDAAPQQDSYAVDPLFANPFEQDVADPLPAQDSLRAEPEPPLPPQPAGLEAQSPRSVPSEPEEILVLHVLSGNGQGFAGEDLVESLLRYDCRFGEMNIFHRREPGSDSIRFSVANSVEPGTFNLDDIKNFTTPGVSFFMRLPGPENALKAFDNMVETAYYLARQHNGVMRDENHSTLTEQTLEHDRQRIRDYLQRQLVRS
ncbi:MAG TPA: cell division protein ZipA [Pseudomonadales bacterium]